MITNLRYADDIALLATSEAELRYRYRSWWIAYSESAANAAYTRQRRQDQGNGENGIACRTLIQNEQLKPGADLRKKLRRHADLTTVWFDDAPDTCSGLYRRCYDLYTSSVEFINSGTIQANVEENVNSTEKL